MGKIRFAVVGDTLYAARLAECIRKHAPKDMEVFGCFSIREAAGFLEKTQPDLLLCEPDAVQDGLSDGSVQIQLTDRLSEKQGKELARSTVQGVPLAVFRYQRGSEILRQIFHIYEKNAKKNLVWRSKFGQMELSAFYAPGGHELLLPVSISYASICGAKERVLLFNLCEFSGMLPLFGEKAGNTFSDLIYGIRKKQEQFLVCLQSVLHHTEFFDYILPPENPEDLYEIQEEDLSFLLKMLQEQTEYTHIIFCCGMLQKAAVQLMEYCGKIFCMIKEHSFGKYRKQEFEVFLKKGCKQGFQEKVTYVSPQTGNGTFVPGVDILAQLQNGEFVQQVRDLTQYEEKERDLSKI